MGIGGARASCRFDKTLVRKNENDQYESGLTQEIECRSQSSCQMAFVKGADLIESYEKVYKRLNEECEVRP